MVVFNYAQRIYILFIKLISNDILTIVLPVILLIVLNIFCCRACTESEDNPGVNQRSDQ